MMGQEQKVTVSQQNDGRFISLLEEVISIKEKYILREIKWYRADATTVRRYFLFSSVLIIFLSVSIPFLTTLEQGVAVKQKKERTWIATRRSSRP